MQAVVNLLQFLGGVILTVGYIPQIRKTIKTKSVEDLDFAYLVSLFVGCALMELYAAYNLFHGVAAMFFVTNTLSTACAGAMLILYLKYRKKEN